MPTAGDDARRPGGRSVLRATAGPTVALLLLGVLTGLLGTAVHLAREDVLGVLVPYGVLLALGMVLACDVMVAAASLGRRPGPGHALLAVAAGRGVVLGLLLLPTAEGDLVLTGLPESTAWILLAVLLPAFAAPMATAVGLRARQRSAGGPVRARAGAGR